MKTNPVIVLIALVMFSLLYSCKIYRNIENINPKVSMENQAGPFDKNELKKLIPGDRIVVNSTTGFKYYMVYQNYSDDKFLGSAWKVNEEKLETPKTIEIPIEEIDQIQVRRVSAAATAPLVAFGALGILIGIYAIVASSSGGYWQN